MKTLEAFARELPQIPTVTVWHLNELAEYRGKQELFTRQSPERLKKLREHALIESAVASNRIEGVEIDQKRVGTVVFGKSHLQDRNEQEVRGYQAALSWIHSDHERIRLSAGTIKRLHSFSRPEIWDSGKFKNDDGEIIEKHPDGRVTVRFKPLSAAETPHATKKSCDLFANGIRNRDVPPLVLWTAFNLDFLCIHPFRDGNGRVSRLLLLLGLYHLGFTAGRYVSLERIIERSKERYYETLQESSQGWHEGRHTPWPYVNYLLFSLLELYRQFEQRYEQMSLPRGEKTEVVRNAVSSFTGEFHINELRKACPEVSVDMIRKVLNDMKGEGVVQCRGRGRHARWHVNR
ncbi:MAG: Fic family protein [Kiritimatiellae bacterium]|nr:Fic family protein [Kiritimatiellia bacterium]